MEDIKWRKSSFSGQGGNCVEVGVTASDTVCMRDSKLGEDGPVLNFTKAEWSAFLKGVYAGEFDRR